MPISVHCPCEHEWTVPDDKAGDGVICPSCGRTVIVPVPEGLDVARAREEARHEAEKEAPPPKTKSFAEALGTWVDQTFVQRRLFTIVTLLVLVVVIPILIWAVSTITTTLQKEGVHFHRGVDDVLDPGKTYGTEEFRRRERARREYEKRLKQEQESAPPEAEKGKTSTKAEAESEPGKLLAAAKQLREQGKPDEARKVLKQLIVKYPDSKSAAEAGKLLEQLQERTK